MSCGSGGIYTNDGGVDHFDHFRAFYPIGRKSRRNWMRLFHFMLDATIINAFILYAIAHPKRQGHCDFRIRLARSLVGGYQVTRPSTSLIKYKNKKGDQLGVPDEIRLYDVGSHLPVAIMTYKRCRFCSTRKEERRTKVECERCQLSLCAVPCFRNYHKAE